MTSFIATYADPQATDDLGAPTIVTQRVYIEPGTNRPKVHAAKVARQQARLMGLTFLRVEAPVSLVKAYVPRADGSGLMPESIMLADNYANCSTGCIGCHICDPV